MPYVSYAKHRKAKGNDPEQQKAKQERRAKGAANYLLKEAAKKSGSTHSGLEKKMIEDSTGKPMRTQPKAKFKGAI